jgi:hypothetical protein
VKAATEAMTVVRDNDNIFAEARITAGTTPMVPSSHNTASWGRP